MKLYHSQFTRSGRARWMLEEAGAPHEVVRLALSKGEHKTPEFQALNPGGGVPVLVDGGQALIESSAIAMHIADKYPEKKLAPPLGSSERADYYRWMVYVPATVDPVLEAITMHTKLLPEAARVPAIAQAAEAKFAHIAGVLQNAVADKKFVVGDSFTAADVTIGSAAGWIGFLGRLGDYPKLAAYHAKLSERPAYVKAYAD